jgi:tetratricopeptide (TPR) repeat protein
VGTLLAAQSPVQHRIELALARVRSQPSNFEAYNELAFAYCRAARDSGDTKLYGQAEAAIDHALKLSPGNREALKLRVTVLNGSRQYAEALKLASDLQKNNHDDIIVWGLLVDANIGLHNLDEAERDAQWILDLRSGSSLGFTKAAELRESFGDPEGAAQFYEEAARRTPQSDLDERAWLTMQNARCQTKLGNAQRAQQLLDEASKLK